MLILEDRFYIAGRGTILSGRIEEECDTPKIGDTVAFDGIQWEVRGVERARALTDPSHLLKHIGLLVKAWSW